MTYTHPSKLPIDSFIPPANKAGLVQTQRRCKTPGCEVQTTRSRCCYCANGAVPVIPSGGGVPRFR